MTQLNRCKLLCNFTIPYTILNRKIQFNSVQFCLKNLPAVSRRDFKLFAFLVLSSKLFFTCYYLNSLTHKDNLLLLFLNLKIFYGALIAFHKYGFSCCRQYRSKSDVVNLSVLQGAVGWEGNLLLTPPPNQYLIKAHNYLETKLKRGIGKRFCCNAFCNTWQKTFWWNQFPRNIFCQRTRNLNKHIYFLALKMTTK